jgi:peptide/nickel transport system substrate-binding protein
VEDSDRANVRKVAGDTSCPHGADQRRAGDGKNFSGLKTRLIWKGRRMSNFVKTTTLGLSLLAFSLLTHSFSASAQTGTIVVAQSSDVLTLDPSVDTSPISLNIFKNIYDQLTDIAADGSVKPQLATSWEVSADAKVWTFTIRTNVKFHDGSMLSVDDVVDSFQKIMKDEKSPVRAYLVRVASVEKVGDDKVRFTLTVPYAPFDRQVSLISILPRKAYAERGASFATNPVGSGPFRVVKWIKDDRIELAANPDYFGGAPKVATVIFRPVPAESARAAALASGEIDIVPLLPPSLVERLSTTRGIGVSKVDSNRVLYIGFDVTNPLLSNQKLRQAINHAINREAITTRLLRGLGKPIGQPVAPVTFGYDASIPAPTFDVDLAKRLVKESGYKGEPILFQYPNNRYAFGQEVAQAIQGYLSAVGINVEMQGMEYSAFFPLWAARKLNSIHMFAFGPSIMDAELPLGSLYETGPSRGYWSDKRIDELVASQRAESDPAKRRSIIAEIWKASAEFVPYSMLYNEVQAYGFRAGVKWQPRPDERLLFGDAEAASK